MTDQVPSFSEGDRVRIMQTSDMEKARLANKHGSIGTAFCGDTYTVLLDEGVAVSVDGCHLMQEQL